MPRRGGFRPASAKPIEELDAAWWDSMTTPEPNTGCLIWLGPGVDKHGYGRIKIKGRKSPQLAHRLAYETRVGAVPASIKVCHRCDHPWCVEPSHLFVGTHGDNMRDMFSKRRARPRGKGWGDRKEQIVVLIAQNPRISFAEIASELDLSYEYITLICRKEGISVMRARPRGRAPGWAA